MMGKTHIAGALASWVLIYPMLAKTSLSNTQDVLVLTVSLCGTVLGGLLPDIDQPGSTIDRELFGPLGMTRIGAMLGGTLLLVISFILRSPNLLRQIMHYPILIGIVQRYPIWVSFWIGILGAVLVIISILKHRGITHTFLMMGLFLWGTDTLVNFTSFLVPWRIALLVVFGAGYLSHLLLDLISEGNPLLYPFVKERLRLPIHIETGSLWDIVLIRYGLLAYFVFAVASLYLPSAMLTRLHI